MAKNKNYWETQENKEGPGGTIIISCLSKKKRKEALLLLQAYGLNSSKKLGQAGEIVVVVKNNKGLPQGLINALKKLNILEKETGEEKFQLGSGVSRARDSKGYTNTHNQPGR